MTKRVKVFFDGGCRPNPGRMELAVVVGGQSYIERDIGYGTHDDAEWLALIAALRTAQSLALTDFVLLGDAVAVIGPANGIVRCRGTSAAHLATLRALQAEAGPAPIRYIKRAQNLAGIALAQLHPR
jgi:ribonuclease HI